MFLYLVVLFIANVMFHLQSLFKWSQFSVVYDKRDPYKAVAEALYEKKSIENMDSSMNWYKIVNSFKVSNDMSDKQIEEIFRQIKKYSRSKLFWNYFEFCFRTHFFNFSCMIHKFDLFAIWKNLFVSVPIKMQPHSLETKVLAKCYLSLMNSMITLFLINSLFET